MAITGTETRRDAKPWGVEVRVKFEEDSKVLRMATFCFADNDEANSQLANRINAKIDKIEIKKSALNDFDIGEDSVEILRASIVKIRNTPTASLSQAETWYENNYPDAVYRFEQFINKAKNYLRKELGYVPTWNQFKTYVINNKFIWTD